ncbi:MAG: flavodoxin-dependent (E)-4-hydroxy-3-methylbut-2-enyl-diphosphate synthase [Ruminococcaceae bacterium]|nr:flavodoxin-dependent (E)-4-hydroxy-3-methylbut-2-enyl-diphosphate synthase [Oscillospiraceae bacterium]
MIYNEIRRSTHAVRVGNVQIGGNAPLAIQSMTNTDTHDVAATLAQIRALEAAGCDVVRMTVPDVAAADSIFAIKEAGVGIPLVADIHFDYRVALACAERGVDKIRINPGNIGEDAHVRAVADACRARGIPIRIGVNGGSLEKEILAKYGAPTAEALAESGLYHAALLQKCDFEDIVISIKSSDVQTMIAANRILAEKTRYPLHLGVTEAGGEQMGSIKSAIGIGALLADGIGDTLRVSLTADPVAEIAAAKRILSALSVEGQCGLNIVSCPTCGRTKIDLIALAARFEAAARAEGLMDLPLRVALMGCAVNGPGEAREADLGICGGSGEALLIARGEILRKIPEEDVIPVLISELKKRKSGAT